eukprot:1441115-Rhodomonas_salina.4
MARLHRISAASSTGLSCRTRVRSVRSLLPSHRRRHRTESQRIHSRKFQQQVCPKVEVAELFPAIHASTRSTTVLLIGRKRQRCRQQLEWVVSSVSCRETYSISNSCTSIAADVRMFHGLSTKTTLQQSMRHLREKLTGGKAGI